jgi:integrase
MGRKRKLPDGMVQRGRAYHADFYAGGRRVRKRLSTDFGAAKEILNDLRARADKADFNLLDNDYPLKELQEKYLAHCRQAIKASTVTRYEKSLLVIMPHIGATRVSQLSLDNMVAFRDSRLADGVSPRTVNIDVQTLTGMLKWGVRPAKLIGSNPLAGLKPLPNDHPKEGRALTPQEVEALLAASPQPWRDIWYAYLVTGMRRNELASLTFADIDWEAREIIVRSSVAKTHTTRRIPIEDGLWEILKRQEAGRQERRPGAVRGSPFAKRRALEKFTREHVFVSRANTRLTEKSSLLTVFRRYCRKAGIEIQNLDAQGHEIDHVDIHSLRRTFATNLIVNCADPKSVQELLGHKRLEMTMKIYTKIHNQTKRQALGRLSYGHGASGPEHVLPLTPPTANPVQVGQQSVTSPQGKSQVVGG